MGTRVMTVDCDKSVRFRKEFQANSLFQYRGSRKSIRVKFGLSPWKGGVAADRPGEGCGWRRLGNIGSSG